MTNDELLKLCEEAERLAGAATEGPWRVYHSESGPTIQVPSGWLALLAWDYCGKGLPQKDNADFIAFSRTLVPRLAAALREMSAKNDGLWAILRSDEPHIREAVLKAQERHELTKEPPCPVDPPRE